MILEPIKNDELTGEALEESMMNWKKVRNAMRDINQKIGKDAHDRAVRQSIPSFDEFLEGLQMTMDDYLLALCTTVLRSTFMFKR